MTSRLRKRFGNWFWPLLLIIFFLLIWQFLWFMWWSSAELPSTDWVDEDVHSKECTNANLLQQYTQAGYKPVHRVTRLKTQQLVFFY
jgi:ABC-type nitrate/sulfonate/bicarbonate transport system permease component